MPELHFTIAEIPFRLALTDASYDTFRPQYDGFVTPPDPNALRLVASPYRARPVPYVPVPRCTLEGPVVRLTAEGRYDLTLNLQSRVGEILYVPMPFDGTTGRPTAGIQSALKAIVAALLAAEGSLLLHCSGVEVDNKAILFVGPSGAGKSTICVMFGEQAVINDELIAIKIVNGQLMAHATPFSGTANTPRERRHLPIGLATKLLKSPVNTAAPLSVASTLPLLVQCIAMPAGATTLEGQVFSTAQTVATRLPWIALGATLNATENRRFVGQCLASVCS